MYRFALVALFSISFIDQAFAQYPVISTVIEANNDTNRFQIPPTTADSSAVFIARSKGNISEFVDVEVTGPNGMRISAEASVYSGNAADALFMTVPWYQIKMVNLQGKKVKSLQTSSTNSDDEIDIDYTQYFAACGLTVMEAAMFSYKHYASTGKKLTKEQVCKYYGKNNPIFPTTTNIVPLTDDQTSTAKGGLFLSKNACIEARKSSYLIKLKLNFASVDPAKLATGFPVTVSMQRNIYQGDMASSIKPVSAGRFRPKPIALMALLSGGIVSPTSSGGYQISYGYIDIVKWKKKKIESVETLKVVDMTYFAGHFLTRTPLDGVLNGGKATFELRNGRYIYGVCFELERRRQKANGYP